MKNLLSSTDIATLFLDNELNVRWFAPQTAEIIHLIASDIGRPVTDLVSRLAEGGRPEPLTLVADADIARMLHELQVHQVELETLMNTPFIDFVHPADREATWQAMAELRAGRQTLDFVNRYRCRDDSVTLFVCVRELLFNIVKHAGFDPAVVRAREGLTGGFGRFNVS